MNAACGAARSRAGPDVIKLDIALTRDTNKTPRVRRLARSLVDFAGHIGAEINFSHAAAAAAVPPPHGSDGVTRVTPNEMKQDRSDWRETSDSEPRDSRHGTSARPP